jgi:class 3 adenylate cyclase/HAMP domain-containing protein
VIHARLFRKYATLILFLVGGTLVVSDTISLYFSYQETRNALQVLEHEKAQSAALRISQFVREIERQLGWTTFPQSVEGSDTAELRRLDLIKLLRQVPAIMEASYIDGSGREQVRIARLALDVVGIGEDRSNDPRFVNASKSGTYFGPVYFRKETEPYMSIASRSGRGTGVTIVEVNLKFIWDVITQIRIGKTGIAYVVGNEGILIAHPDISLVLKKTDMSHLPQIKAALAGNSSETGGYGAGYAHNSSGRSVLTAYSRIKPLGWTVFVEQPLSEALQPVYASLKRTGAVLFTALALSALASLALAMRMVRPINALRKGARAIGSGQLDHRIGVITNDELQDLGEGFNDMASKLQESYAGLEQKVEERTRELAASRAQLAEWNATLEKRVAEGIIELEHMGRLKRFLAPQVAELIAKGTASSLGSHGCEVAVVFLDLRGFTSFTESSEPEEVMGVLHEYHAAMGRLIMRYEGTLERFLGDGIMILFNDPIPIPDPEVRAVCMAVEMHNDFLRLSAGWKQRGFDLQMGIGIAQGHATLGVIGFEGRQDYSAIGSVCNLAARLCAEARGGQTLVSERVLKAVEGFVESEPAGELALKGFSRPVLVWNIRSLRP